MRIPGEALWLGDVPYGATSGIGRSRLRGCTLRALAAASLLLSIHSVNAQVCRLSVAGLNQSRRVAGDIHAECPETIEIHTAPFGNWGVTSNFGQKGNSHQFDGWCHNTRICDNTGACKTDCQDGWYEWNSCTNHPLYSAPNCTLYNSANCTEQVTATAVNVHGTRYVDIPVRCPFDSNGDGIPDSGGCADVTSFSSGTNFLSLYELDPGCCDELVQTVYFPAVTLNLACDVFGCAGTGSSWLSPLSWDSPSSPAKVFAELAVVVNWGAFVDTSGGCKVTAGTLSAVSSASFIGPNLAPESIGTVFGQGLAPGTEQATTLPLPTTLGGITVHITDRANVTRSAPLFYASPGQVNFQVPAGTAVGAATISMYSADVLRSKGTLQVESVVPGIYTANSNGKGVAAATAIRIGQGDTVSVQSVFECPAGVGSCVPAPLDLGSDTDRTYLTLYGTGIRHVADTTAVPATALAATIGGENATVSYAGPQGYFVGLDQVNILVPQSLRGRGVVDVSLTVNSKPANVVQVAIR